MMKSPIFFAIMMSIFSYSMASEINNGYDVLFVSCRMITANGEIDPNVWEKQDSIPIDLVSIGSGLKRKEFLVANKLLYDKISKEDPNGEARRYLAVSARKEFEIKSHRIWYQGKKLKYSSYVRGVNAWGITRPDNPPLCFRFGKYLIFLVETRIFSGAAWDFVAYNLENDEFYVHKTIGAWPSINVFHHEEGKPDPRAEIGGE